MAKKSRGKNSPKKKLRQRDWEALANRYLRQVLRQVQLIPKLAARVKSPNPWQADLQLINRPRMAALNDAYRGKDYPTDILSFPAPALFCQRGILGELVICLPVLKFQAQELGHSVQHELRVLLIHGVLHLLGYDHERSQRAAIEMAELENSILGSHLGLIDRTGSGKEGR